MPFVRKTFSSIFAVLAITSASLAAAADDSPVGTWKTIDDKTGHAKSLVQISEAGDELQAKVLRVIESDRGPHPLCVACEGDRKGKPIEGMTIMWGVKKQAGSSWDGGSILDPQNGKTYSVKLTLADGGKKLDVRGYMGVSLLGRTQTWQREK
jgi:uncharacterized protein (DUF2147 family)